MGAYVETQAHASKDACLVDVKFPRCVSANTHKVCGLKNIIWGPRTTHSACGRKWPPRQQLEDIKEEI